MGVLKKRIKVKVKVSDGSKSSGRKPQRPGRGS